MEEEDVQDQAHQRQPPPPPPPNANTRRPALSPVHYVAIFMAEMAAIMIEFEACLPRIQIPFPDQPFRLTTTLIYYMLIFLYLGPAVDWFFAQIGSCLDELGRELRVELPLDHAAGEGGNELDNGPGYAGLGELDPDELLGLRSFICVYLRIVFGVLYGSGGTNPEQLQYIDYMVVFPLGFHFRLARYLIKLFRRHHRLRDGPALENIVLLVYSTGMLLYSILNHYQDTMWDAFGLSTDADLANGTTSSLSPSDVPTNPWIVQLLEDHRGPPHLRGRPNLTQLLGHSVSSYLHVLGRRGRAEIWMENYGQYLV